MAVTSCSEDEITPDRNELYNREFIKDHGVPEEGHSWSEARAKAITIKSSQPTPVIVSAEVGGKRFMFAHLSSVQGVEPIVVNVPKTVEELIVETSDYEEYRIPVGTVLDLDKARASRASSSATSVGSKLTVSYDSEDIRQLVWNQKSMDQLLFLYHQPGNDYLTTYDNIYGYKSPRYRPNSVSWYNIYPTYWRENVHGESDYLLGAYFRETDTGEITMIDFEGFDIKSAISVSTNGGKTWIEQSGNQAYDFSLKNNSQFRLRTTGLHVKAEGFASTSVDSNLLGFYVKSGLKDTYTEGKGRDFTHISFSELKYNKEYWGDNYWNMSLDNVDKAYSGARGYRSLGTNGQNGPKANITVSGEVETNLFPLYFSSMPNGGTQRECDFCDCTFVIRGAGSTNINQASPRNKSYRYCFPWYLAAEDLGGSFDWDFNDLVVNIYDITTDYGAQASSGDASFPVPVQKTRRIVVKPCAAGGTMPIYLMYEGKVGRTPTGHTYLSELRDDKREGTFVIGTELHRWLKASGHGRPLNVDGNDFSNQGCAVSFSIPYDYPPFDEQKPPKDLGSNNSTLHGFWVMVDSKDEMRLYESVPFNPAQEIKYETLKIGKETVKKELELIDDVVWPFSGKLGEGVYRIDAPTANTSRTAPQMILTHYSWYWPRELVNITKAWPLFDEWVADQSVQWYSDITGNGLYQPAQCCIPPSLPNWIE